LKGEEIWPPTLAELTVSHYDRMAKLSDPAALSTDVIRKVTDCYPVYQSLLDELDHWGFQESAQGGPAGRVVSWHYDWRQDNRNTAALLSADLANRKAAGVTDIAILAHSMGGLIARYALEVNDPNLGDTSWRDACKLLVTMGTPHRGAPVALVRAMGLESSMGMRATDIQRFAADPRYPSAYQLLPPTDAFGFWSSDFSAQPLPPLDLSDPEMAALLKLNPVNLKAWADLYGALRGGTRPTGCRYFNFIGRKLETVVRGDVDGKTAKLDAPKIQDGGDGTVPIWSGTLPGTQFQLDGEEHGRTFRDAALLLTTARLLGVPPDRVRAPAIPPELVLKIPKPLFVVGEEARFRVESHLPQGSVIEVQLQQIDENAQPVGGPIVLTTISLETQSDVIIVSVVLPPQEGLYTAAAVLQGTQTSSDPQYLAIQKA
jgi:pimeloyl-ACP methyl ester carboxylesterase